MFRLRGVGQWTLPAASQRRARPISATTSRGDSRSRQSWAVRYRAAWEIGQTSRLCSLPARAVLYPDGSMDYVRKVDFAAIQATGPDERFSQPLFDWNSGAKTCTINCIKTPPGGGSPAGLHVHDVDQIFYILDGTMSIEIEGQTHECGPGSLIVFPAGVPHRNWNAGSQPTLHLAFNTPQPDPNVPFARSAS